MESQGPFDGEEENRDLETMFQLKLLGKMPEVEWFSSVEKTQKSKKVV